MTKLFGLMKMLLFIAGLVAFTATAVQANDSAVVGQGGRVRFLKGEHKSVRMVRETVKVDLYRAYYDVDATFVFQNLGQAVTVRMGFPERGGGGIDVDKYRRETAFLSFATWVDGQTVAAHREPAEGNADEEQYEAFWVKTVSFAPGQTRIVRVRYRSPTGEQLGSVNVRGESKNVMWRSASYDFTGGNWRGKVDSSVLTLTSHLASDAIIKTEPRMPQKGRTLTFQRSNWQAQKSVFVQFRQPGQYL